MKLSKKIILTIVVLLGCLVLVTFVLASPHWKSSSKAVWTTTQTKQPQDQVSQTSQKKQPSRVNPPSKKDIKAFNQKAIDNNYYVEVQGQDGNQGVAKANADNLKQLEQKKQSEVSIYQINQDGQWITVIGRKK